MRHSSFVILLISVCFAATIGERPAFTDDQRFSAMLADGNRLAGDEVADWADENAQPKLNNRRVFDQNNPFRWLIDRSLPMPSLPDSYVEFAGGDRLPGEVIGFRTGGEAPHDRLPPYLIIEPQTELHWPEFGDESAVRVATEWLQRVVWQRQPDALQPASLRPNTVFLRDGRQIRFRSLRWANESISLLGDEGVQQVAMSELAEVHFPQTDPWEGYYEQLAVLTPECTARLMQLETADGLKATVSTERLQATHQGDRNQPENWYHVVQPAWSLDPLWVQHRTVRTRRFFDPHRVPLTLLTPAGVRQESTFGSGWRWQVNQSVYGLPLRSGGEEFGWGLGVHALSELQYDLPAAVQSFQTRMGLDEMVGDGGCVRAIIAVDAGQKQELFQSEPLVGSETVVESGSLSLEVSPERPGRLILTVDPLHEGRPAGADPFDIRDSFDWLEPELELDPEQLQAEVAKRAFGRLSACEGWALAEEDEEAVSLMNHWDISDPRDPRYRLLLAIEGASVGMSRQVSIGQGQQWLALAVHRVDKQGGSSQVEVLLEGQSAAEFEVPVRTSVEPPDPVLVPVEKLQGRTVTVEIVQTPEEQNAFLDWRGVTPVSHRPGLLRVFEDEAEFAAELRDGQGDVTLDRETPHSGRAALRVTPPERSNADLPGLNVPIREHPRLGEFRYIRFAWRKAGGTRIGLGIGHHSRFDGHNLPGRGPGRRADLHRPEGYLPRRGIRFDNRGAKHGYRYDAGEGDPIQGTALRLDPRLPDEWRVVTRDLYGDLGTFTLTGLAFHCPDGEAAWFDHIYLARTRQDLEHIAELSPPGEEPAQPQTDD